MKSDRHFTNRQQYTIVAALVAVVIGIAALTWVIAYNFTAL